MTIGSTITFILFFIIVSAVVTVSALPDSEEAPLLRRRQLQTDPDATCEITGFSFYDSTSDMPKTVYTSVLDLTDFDTDEINIKVNTEGTACGCIKISFAGKAAKDKGEPFYLYGDNAKKGSIKYKTPNIKDGEGSPTLEAWAYTEKTCKGDEISYKSLSFSLVIPYDTPREVTLDMDPFTVAYESTEGPVENAEDTNKAIEITCNYFKSSLGYGFIYKSDISLQDVSCEGSAVEDGTDSPLKIEYTISASFYKWTGFNPYVNRLLPTLEEMNAFIFRLVTGGTGGPFMPPLIQNLQSKLTDTNVYSTVTALSLVE